MSDADLERLISQVEQLIRAERWEPAETAAAQLVAVAPHLARVWACSGAVHLHARRFQPAEESFRQATALNPQDSASWHNLSIALHEQQRLDEAESASQQAVSLFPKESSFWFQLGNVLFSVERFSDAAHAFERSVALDPSNPTAWNGLGVAHHAQANWTQARRAYESSLALLPSQLETRLSLVRVVQGSDSMTSAEQISLQLVADYPLCADAWSHVGLAQQYLAKVHEAIVAHRRAFELDPSPERHSRVVQSMQYADGVSSSALLAEHQHWDRLHAAQLLLPPHAARGSSPLRIGFVSSHFVFTPVAFVVLPLLKAIDKRRCLINCYFDSAGEDSFTPQFRDVVDQWRATHGLSDQALADQIRADRIDVLFDLLGHAGNRLLVFARKPAPTQVTWFGYVGTTGLSAMDYLLADRFHVPPGEESQYAESVLRMPKGYACYAAPEYAPPVTNLPALSTGQVTFGCFNYTAKWSPRILDLWSEILHRVPTARLFLKYHGLQDAKNRDHFRSLFAARGIEPDRIILEGSSPHAEFLAAYNRVDIALDTQPYSGGLTTCEALWMGVPVITYPGQTFAGRHATSHLTNAGYPQFIAKDEAGYVDLAVHWANQIPSLAALRAEMREQMRRSPLCDAGQFAEDFLQLITARITRADKNVG